MECFLLLWDVWILWFVLMCNWCLICVMENLGVGGMMLDMIMINIELCIIIIIISMIIIVDFEFLFYFKCDWKVVVLEIIGK